MKTIEYPKQGIAKGPLPSVVMGGRRCGKSAMWAEYLKAIEENEEKIMLEKERERSVSNRTLSRLYDIMWSSGDIIAEFIRIFAIAFGVMFGGIMLVFSGAGIAAGNPAAYIYVSGTVLMMAIMIGMERNSRKSDPQYFIPFSLSLTPMMFSWLLLPVVACVWHYSYMEKRREKQQDFEDRLKGKARV